MRVVLDRSDEVLEWARQHFPAVIGVMDDAARAIGVEGADGLIAAVIFHQWQPSHGTIQASTVATDARWLRCRALYDAVFSYAFGVCQCHKIWAVTPRGNERALRMLRAFGMIPEAILSKHLRGEDAVISRKFVWEWAGVRQEAKSAYAA